MISPYPPSPVPSDSDLPEGILPFTAFGQFGPGKLDKRVFEQDVYWVDVLGQPHFLEEMSSEYLGNVLAMLFGRMEEFYFSALMRYVAGIIEDDALGKTNVDILARMLGTASIAELTPSEWLASTPLVRKINKLLEASI